MNTRLKDMKVAILVADGFEQIELESPRAALQQAGAEVHIISPAKDKVQGWHHDNRGDEFPVDVELAMANAENYAALMLPGGVRNPDHLRLVPAAIEFIKYFVKANKPIAAICHAPWTLINAEGVRDKMMTSWPSLKMDLINAGANWLDSAVVRDKKLLTSRKPEDLLEFNPAMIELFGENKPKV